MSNAFKYRVDMFDKFNPSENEKEFIEGVDNGVFNSHDHVKDFYDANSILSNYYLAKQIEASSNKLTDEIGQSITRLNIAMNTNINNLIKSNQQLAASNFKQATALNIFSGILVILTAAMLYKMIWPS